MLFFLSFAPVCYFSILCAYILRCYYFFSCARSNFFFNSANCSLFCFCSSSSKLSYSKCMSKEEEEYSRTSCLDWWESSCPKGDHTYEESTCAGQVIPGTCTLALGFFLKGTGLNNEEKQLQDNLQDNFQI
jgi:hypothetical protein